MRSYEYIIYSIHTAKFKVDPEGLTFKPNVNIMFIIARGSQRDRVKQCHGNDPWGP